MKNADSALPRLLRLIRLRWIAAGCLFLVLTSARFLIGLRIPAAELYIGNAALLAVNLACLALFRQLQGRAEVFIAIQISVDLALLAYLLHFSGGMENPFAVFFISLRLRWSWSAPGCLLGRRSRASPAPTVWGPGSPIGWRC